MKRLHFAVRRGVDGRIAEPARVVVADPPWSFNDKLPGASRGAEKNYKVLDLEGIKNFKLPLIDDDAALFMWRVSSQVEEAYEVVRAWGFVPKTEIVWCKLTRKGGDAPSAKFALQAANTAGVQPQDTKLHFGMGRYVRASHESCIVAVRGRMVDKVLDRAVRSVFYAPTGEHSEKPAVFFQLVERLFEGPYVEMFSRHHRTGWTCYGNEVGKLGKRV